MGIPARFITVYYMGVSSIGGTLKCIVYKGKSYKKWVIYGYPYVRKPPYSNLNPSMLKENSLLSTLNAEDSVFWQF